MFRLPPAGSVKVVLPSPTTTPFPTFTPAPTPTPGPILVYVCGEVNQPDVYELPADSIVKDAIEAAGGETILADLDQINLAEKLRDEAQVIVPAQGEIPSRSSVIQLPTRSESLNLNDSGVVNINTASLEQLDTLPGIGPVLAQRIVDYRPYRHVDDILEVPGIGDATYAELKELIVVQ